MVKLTAEYEGIKFTRTTNRTYTHVIIVRNPSEAWGAISWAGSYELAMKRLNSKLVSSYKETKIIPVSN
ncbi:MAG: hypothetical protein WC102_01615 [Saccharofermentanales bacterium]